MKFDRSKRNPERSAASPARPFILLGRVTKNDQCNVSWVVWDGKTRFP